MGKPYFLESLQRIWKMILKKAFHYSMEKLFVFLFFIVLSHPNYALPTANEYDIKATFLYKLKHFIIWPQLNFDTSSQFVICILGQDPFHEKLDLVIKAQPATENLVKILRITEIEQAQECQILFISESKQLWLDSILKWLDRKPILSVSDMPDFASHGGMIEFYKEEERIRLAINPQNVNKATLKVSTESF